MNQKMIERLVAGVMAVEGGALKSPDSPVKRNEIVVGKVTDVELQKLFAFYGQTVDAFNTLAKKLRHSAKEAKENGADHDPATCPNCKAVAEAEVEQEFTEVVTGMLWVAVKESLSPEGKVLASRGGGIGLRADWQIVVMPRDMHGMLAELAIHAMMSEGAIAIPL